jgi:hypothetical protein
VGRILTKGAIIEPTRLVLEFKAASVFDDNQILYIERQSQRFVPWPGVCDDSLWDSLSTQYPSVSSLVSCASPRGTSFVLGIYEDMNLEFNMRPVPSHPASVNSYDTSRGWQNYLPQLSQYIVKRVCI